MGTSNSFGGPGGGTPLVPSWLGGDASGISSDQQTSDGADTESEGTIAPTENNVPSPVIPNNVNADSGDRFQLPRTNFTRFAKSGGRDRAALGRAISGYISRSNGGVRNAVRRMGASRAATGGLITFLNSARTQGVENTLRSLNFTSLIGQSIEDIFAGLTDFICPDGGTIDEGIARNAFIETITQLAEQGISDLNSITYEQMQMIIELYATNAIEARLCNDIGTKICVKPENIAMVEAAQAQLHDFIFRSVSDAMERYSDNLRELTPSETTKFVDTVYEEAFIILQTISEQESTTE